MARYETYSEIEGWTRWISPPHGGHGRRNYRLACCDCALVHEIQFRVTKDPAGRLSVSFRAKRNHRATASMRSAERRAKAKR